MQSDETLARGVQHGNQANMNALIEWYYEPLLRYLYRLCGGRQALAEDLVQDTFIRMMRGITSYDPNRPFKPWLYAIATNIARNHFQSADTRRTHNPADEDHDQVDVRPQPESVLMQAEAQQAVANALMRLPEHQRTVVVLFYYEELPQQDIADILDIPVGTVKSRLSIGLKRLRTIVETMELLS